LIERPPTILPSREESSHKVRQGNNLTGPKMKNFYLCLIIPLVCIVVQSLAAQTPATVAKPKQFVYVLHLVPRLYDDKNWTQGDMATLDRHFNRFKHAIEAGELILVGRTREPGDKNIWDRNF
jgi:hypothetical protein